MPPHVHFHTNKDPVRKTGTTQGISRKGFNSGNWRVTELLVMLRKQRSGKDVISLQEVWNYGRFGKLPPVILASYNTNRDNLQGDTQELLHNLTSAISRGQHVSLLLPQEQ